MRIVFFGTPGFAATILEYLLSQKVSVLAVVSRPDKPKKRSRVPLSSEVKKCALAHNLPLYQPVKASDPLFASFLKSLDADFFIVAAYAEILKENVLELPRFGCINVHGSVLPKYRGPAPVQRAIMAGESESGVTIMKMAPLVDAGGILAIKKTPIPLEMTAGELMEVLAELGKTALFDVMQKLEKGEIEPLAQNCALVTLAKKITADDAKVNWDGHFMDVHNQIRAVTPNPGAWCWVEINGEAKRLLIKKSLPLPLDTREPGHIVSATPKELIVGCKKGSVRILELQLEGKKQLSAEQFLCGTPLSKIKFLDI